MGVIWTPQQRTKQPQQAVGINKRLQLTKRITTLVPFGPAGMFDLVSGSRVALASGTLAGDERGISLRGSGSAACASIPLNLSSYTKIVLSFWMYWNAFANDDDLAMEFTANGASTTGGFGLDPNESSTSRFQIFGNGGGNAGAKSFTRPSAAAWHHYMVGLDTSVSGFVSSVYVDGVSQSLITDVALNVPVSFANSTLYLFSRNNANLFAAGRMQNLVIRGGADLLESEVQEEYRNPWHLFEPERRPLFFGVGSASGSPYSLDADAGSYSVTGVAAAFKASRTLVAEAGAYSLTGVAAGLSYGHSLTAEAGSYSVTGVAATFQAARTIAAEAGSYTVSGQDATFTYTPVGSGSPYSMDADAGSYTLTGVAAIFQASRTILAAAGFYALTGVDASFTRSGYRLVAETGSYVISGQSATFSTTGTSTPTTGGGGGKGHGSNLSRKQKKKLKAVESQEWLKAEETARQLLSDRFTKQTPQEKAEALQTYVESLQPVIEALKALTEPVEEAVEEPVIELTPHQEILTRFDTLEKKLKSVEELVIILMADL